VRDLVEALFGHEHDLAGVVSTRPEKSIWTSALLSWFAISIIALLFAIPADAETTAEIYKTRCASCHGKKGAADTTLGRSLDLRPLDSEEVLKQSDDDLFTIISKGKKKRMPAYGNKLSQDEIRNLVKYIRSLKQ
jgi:mono/diheme cytochrome c family protein